MPTNQQLLRCRRCERKTLHVVIGANHLLHLVLTIVTAGLWLLVWLAVGVGGGRAPACTECGKSRGAFGLW